MNNEEPIEITKDKLNKNEDKNKERLFQMNKQFQRMRNVSKIEFKILNISEKSDSNQTSNTSDLYSKAKQFHEKLQSIINDGKVDGNFLNDQKEGNKLVKINLLNFMEEKLKLYDTFITNIKKSESLYEKFKFLKEENARVTEKFAKIENSTLVNNDRFKLIPNLSFESLVRDNLKE